MTEKHAEIYVELMADLMRSIVQQSRVVSAADRHWAYGETDDIKKKLVCIVRGLG